MSDIPPARPASTVVLLRESQAGLETLLLRRNKALQFAGGLWVFPGGALDEADLSAAGGDEFEAARLAAAREAFEESGLRPRLDDMVQLSHWTTPEAEPKRFATWFFAAPLDVDETVQIDGGEIHDALWVEVSDALRRHEAGELGMLPPTYVTLLAISRYASLEQLIQAERERPSPQVLPTLAPDGPGFCVMFQGDAGYVSGEADIAGPRHRARMLGGRWEYLYCDVDTQIAPLVEPLS